MGTSSRPYFLSILGVALYASTAHHFCRHCPAYLSWVREMRVSPQKWNFWTRSSKLHQFNASLVFERRKNPSRLSVISFDFWTICEYEVRICTKCDLLISLPLILRYWRSRNQSCGTPLSFSAPLLFEPGYTVGRRTYNYYPPRCLSLCHRDEKLVSLDRNATAFDNWQLHEFPSSDRQGHQLAIFVISCARDFCRHAT